MLSHRARVGVYEVVALVGAGGMGEVYRARDTSLNRDVALKVLPPEVAADAERLARFRREAQVLAALNHPNIAQVYGLEEGAASPALVMEFVEGEDLGRRIGRGPIQWYEALPIARQIAEALEAAHESGIIHRDLKPANIKVRGDGTVKVLDFGLAKAIEPGVGPVRRSLGEGGSREPFDEAQGRPGTGVADSPTITTPAMTKAGIILGTAAYMSPEQARGRAVDKRTDIWAFGCVLFEMLTGGRAFEGEDVSDTLAAILRSDPDWSRWPADAPDAVKQLVLGCLERDRRLRVPDIGVARYLLAQPIPKSASVSGAMPAAAASGAPPPVARIAAVALAAFAAGALAAVVVTLWTRTGDVDRPATSPPAHFRVSLDPAPFISRTSGTLAIAADGSFFVYPGLADGQLFFRAIDEVTSRPVAGTSGARDPFISPDGDWIGFFAGEELKRIPVAGGVAQTICRFPGASRGGAWSEDGSIVFASSLSNGLLRVPASGGAPSRLTSADATEPLHAFPSFLPGGRAVLFNILPAGFTGGNAIVAFVDLSTGTTSTVAEGFGLWPRYVPSGHVVIAQSDELRAAPFDLDSRRFTGGFVPIAGTLSRQIGPTYAVSTNGVLVYTPPESGGESPRTLVWVDRQGRETALDAPPRAYETARVSPDGTRVAVDIRDEASDIWVWEIARRTLTRLTVGREDDMGPLWSTDGQHVLYSSNQSAIPNVYRRRANGIGEAERLTESATTNFLTSVSPTNRLLVLFLTPAVAAGSGIQIAVAPFDANAGPARELKVIVSGKGNFVGGEVSTDGRWLAYHSNESGRHEVYVRPFPDVDGGRWQISSGGGSRPAWSRDGRELFFLNAEGVLVSVPATVSGGTLSAGSVTPILNRAYVAGASARGLDLRSYDVAPDGQRFLMIKEAAPRPRGSDSGSLIVVTNWFDEVRRRVPVGK